MSEERIQTGDLVRDDADAPVGRDADAPAGTADAERLDPLFDQSRQDELRDRWHALQARFDGARSKLEAQWSSGEDVSTEDLRVSLQRYRSFFERLLEA